MTFESAGINHVSNGESEVRTPLPAGKGRGKEELPRVLRCLFEEHRHLSALMRALERKVRQAGKFDKGDYYLLRDIIGYLHDYPDQVHHPTENLLFEMLLQREPSAKDAVAGLRRDHKAVAIETRELLELLDKAIEQPDKQAEKAVRHDCQAFIEHQRKHMQFENQKLFPAAIDSLSQTDWKKIESHFAAVDDPVFGRVVGNRHRLLYEYLVNPADKAADSFSVSRLFSLERLIMTVDVLEEGTGSWCARLKNLGEEVYGETRSAFAKSLKPESIGSAISLPVKYTAFLGRSVLDCSGDLAGIYAETAKKTLSLYTGRESIG